MTRVFIVPVLAGLLAAIAPITVGLEASIGQGWRLTAPPPDLRDGDLVLRRGVDAVGRIVLSYGEQTRFSHVGVIVRDGGSVLVAHALPGSRDAPGGVRIEGLDVFASPARASDVGYYRVGSMTTGQRGVVRQYIFDQVGTPFDARFEYSDDGALYCTELALKALSQAGIDITGSLQPVHVVMLKEPAFTPDSLRQVPGLDEIGTDGA